MKSTLDFREGEGGNRMMPPLTKIRGKIKWYNLLFKVKIDYLENEIYEIAATCIYKVISIRTNSVYIFNNLSMSLSQ